MSYEVERLIEIYQQLEDAGLMVIAGKKDSAELMVSHDAVPVVRCKDCKHYEKDTMWCKVNSNPRSATYPNWYADDFCSYGERRTDDDCCPTLQDW